MNEPIEDLYFNWLCAKVNNSGRAVSSTSHQSLLYILHTTEYVWLVSGDDNRAGDGAELRREFRRELRLDIDQDWMLMPCSVLEMLIALAADCAYQTELTLYEWFWTFIFNLGLSDVSDARYYTESHLIAPVLDKFIWRKYNRLGHGGIFPLRGSDNDQREVELWYQFCEYVVDQDIS